MATRTRKRPVKLCCEKTLPLSQVERAAERSLSENPANMPSLGRDPRRAMGAPPRGPARMALLTGTRWAPGRKLTCKFMGGTARVRQKIQKYAEQWMEHANVELVFEQSTSAEIRIAFDRNDGSWSYLGNEALSISRSKSTMNYGWLYDDTQDTEYSRVVLHEFGHALGCIHEHSHPRQGIPWNKPKVYDYYKRTNNWSKSDVDAQVFAKYSESSTNFSAFDKSSIMLYAVPNELTIGNYSVGWNTNLSSNDKSFIKKMYPGQEHPETELAVGGPIVHESIGSFGDEDVFSFEVKRSGTYRVETTGTTDVVMLLLGPDTQTKRIAEDDDSGWGRNSRIERHLSKGTYFARVRHYSKRRTGKYGIRVKKKWAGWGGPCGECARAPRPDPTRQIPRKTGFRFSAKAARASSRSSVGSTRS